MITTKAHEEHGCLYCRYISLTDKEIDLIRLTNNVDPHETLTCFYPPQVKATADMQWLTTEICPTFEPITREEP